MPSGRRSSPSRFRPPRTGSVACASTTRDSKPVTVLGVGSTLDQIRAHHAVRMAVGEGTVLAFVQELEMSFGFGRRLYPSVNLPASAKVESVLVVLPPRELLRQPPVQKR